MTNTDLLREKITESGMTITYIARALGITREGFYNKLSGKTEFNAPEIEELKNLLRLTREERDNIFFAKIVN